jgi:hypothetical protein
MALRRRRGRKAVTQRRQYTKPDSMRSPRTFPTRSEGLPFLSALTLRRYSLGREGGVLAVMRAEKNRDKDAPCLPSDKRCRQDIGAKYRSHNNRSKWALLETPFPLGARIHHDGHADIINAGSCKPPSRCSSDESNRIDTIIQAHTPRVPSTQMERTVTTLRSHFHKTMARHAQTTSLRVG